MNEIYWLTRLDDLKMLIGFTIAFAVTALIFGIGTMGFNFDRYNDYEKRNYCTGKKNYNHQFNYSICAFYRNMLYS